MLGLVALSILPASAAQFQAAAQQGTPERQGGAGANSSPGQRDAAAPSAQDMAAMSPRVNTLPFRQLFHRAVALYDSGVLDLTKPLRVGVEADREPDGTLVNIAIVGLPGDKSLDRLARDFVLAVGSSRVLHHLEGARHIRLNLTLDGERLSAAGDAEFDSAERASKLAHFYDVVFGFQRAKTAGTDRHVVWQNMTASASGKQLALKLEMTRAEAGNLLLKQIAPN